MAIVAFIVLFSCATMGGYIGVLWRRERQLTDHVKKLYREVEQNKKTIKHAEQKARAVEATLAAKLDRLIDGDRELQEIAKPQPPKPPEAPPPEYIRERE